MSTQYEAAAQRERERERYREREKSQALTPVPSSLLNPKAFKSYARTNTAAYTYRHSSTHIQTQQQTHTDTAAN